MAVSRVPNVRKNNLMKRILNLTIARLLNLTIKRILDLTNIGAERAIHKIPCNLDKRRKPTSLMHVVSSVVKHSVCIRVYCCRSS